MSVGGVKPPGSANRPRAGRRETDMSEDAAVNSPVDPAADDVSATVTRAVDILLGLALALLALNHVREFFSDASYWPGNLVKTVPRCFSPIG